MKTSIFDMTFVLPPLVEMTEVEKDIYEATGATVRDWLTGNCTTGFVEM